jgi:hypothetical protein
MSEHFRQVCYACQVVVRQCRCPGPKYQSWVLCEACRKQTPEVVTK